jgi:hypothetical protein
MVVLKVAMAAGEKWYSGSGSALNIFRESDGYPGMAYEKRGNAMKSGRKRISAEEIIGRVIRIICTKYSLYSKRRLGSYDNHGRIRILTVSRHDQGCPRPNIRLLDES